MKPKTIFQKKYSKVITFNGKSVTIFPGRYGTLIEGKQIAIPKETLQSRGIPPSPENQNTIYKIYNLLKTPITGYANIQDIVILSGLPKQEIHNNLVWLVKNQKARLNVDRWGNAVYVKLEKERR